MHREDRSRSPGDNSEMRSATCSVRIRLLATGRITAFYEKVTNVKADVAAVLV